MRRLVPLTCALALACGGGGKPSRKLVVLHTNDEHSHDDVFSKAGLLKAGKTAGDDLVQPLDAESRRARGAVAPDTVHGRRADGTGAPGPGVDHGAPRPASVRCP